MADSIGKRMSMIFNLESRAGGLTKDCFITNGFAEPEENAVYMRPGVTLYKTSAGTRGQAVLTGTATNSAGMWVVTDAKLFSGVA
jgi:hypothetical protein